MPGPVLQPCEQLLRHHPPLRRGGVHRELCRDQHAHRQLQHLVHVHELLNHRHMLSVWMQVGEPVRRQVMPTGESFFIVHVRVA